MDLQLIISLIAAAGLGSIFTTCIQECLISRRDSENRKFEEKKEAFIGLLKAYHSSAVDPSEKNAKEFGYWQLRCELVASDPVRKAVQRMIDTSGDEHPDRPEAYKEFLKCLRDDLGIMSR